MINLNLFKNVPQNISIKLAESKDELSQAYQLIYQNYLKQGFTEQHISELFLTYYNMLPQTSTLIAKRDEEVIGTLSIVYNYSLMLPLLKDQDRAIHKLNPISCAQLIDFAIKGEHQFSNVHFLLLKYCYHYSLEYLKLENLIIAVPPKRMSSYRYLFGFIPITEPYFNSRLNGKLFIGMKLNLRDAYDYMAINFGKRREASNLFMYFTKFNFDSFFKFPKRDYFISHDPVMTPKLLDYFFNYETSLLSELDTEQKEALHYFYTGRDYRELIPEVDYNMTYQFKRTSRRFPVSLEGQLQSQAHVMNIKLNSVSMGGFSVIFFNPYALKLNDEILVKVKVAPFIVSQLKVKLVWKKSHLEYGFALIHKNSIWTQYITYLESRLEAPSPGVSSRDEAA